MDEMQKIALIRLSSIGDIVLTTPLIRAVRKAYPDAVIDFIVKAQYVDLLKTNPHLSNVIAFDHTAGWKELWRLKQIIKQEQYTYLIDLHKNLRSVYLCMGSRASVVLQYKKEYWKRSLLLWLRINRFKPAAPIFKRYFHALASLNIVPDQDGSEIVVPSDVLKKVRTICGRDGLRIDRPTVVLCPGAGYSTKRWMPDGFAAVGDYFCNNYQSNVIILGGESDRLECETVQNQMMSKVWNYTGAFTLMEAAALLKLSTIVITNDTGLMHIAQSQKKPVVALFGSTSQELGYFPFPEKSFVIEKSLSCRPCTHNGKNKCPKGHFNCMKGIEPDEVIKAAEQLYLSENHQTGNNIGKNVVSSV